MSARERAEDELVRVYERLEREIQHNSTLQGLLAEAERAAGEKESALLVELARVRAAAAEQEAEYESQISSNTIEKGRLSRRLLEAEAHNKDLQARLASEQELADMHQDTTHALENELSRIHESNQSINGVVQGDASTIAGDSTQPIRSQEFDELEEENSRLECELAKASLKVQELEVTELVNKTLENDKKRLQADLRHMKNLERENIRLNSKLGQLERLSRAWAAYIPNTSYSSPKALAKQVATLESRVGSLQRTLATMMDVVELQKKSANDAIRLQAKCDALANDLETAHQLQTRLKLQVDIGKTHIAMLEDHLADKPFDKTQIETLEARFKSSEASKKRIVPPSESESVELVDSLIARLTQTDKDLQDTRAELEIARQDLAAGSTGETLSTSVLPGRLTTEEFAAADLLGALERENAALKSQASAVPLESFAVLNTRLEHAQMSAQRKASETERVIAELKTRIAKMQIAERSLFGYELELKNNATCLVRSEYTLNGIDTSMDSRLNFFEFRYDAVSKKYNDISETSSLQPYEGQCDLWIKERHNIPAFLASVLLANYEKFNC